MEATTKMKINQKGNVEIEFAENEMFTLKTPPWPTVRQMADKTVLVEILPDADIHIAEVAILTGYNANTLRQLDGKHIPPSSRQEDGSRTWKAADVIKIRDRRRQLRVATKVPGK